MGFLGIDPDTWMNFGIAVFTAGGTSIVSVSQLSGNIQRREQRNKILDSDEMSSLHSLRLGTQKHVSDLDKAVEYLIRETPRVHSTDLRLARKVEEALIDWKASERHLEEAQKISKRVTSLVEAEKKSLEPESVFLDRKGDDDTALWASLELGEVNGLWKSKRHNAREPLEEEVVGPDQWDEALDEFEFARGNLSNNLSRHSSAKSDIAKERAAIGSVLQKGLEDCDFVKAAKSNLEDRQNMRKKSTKNLRRKSQRFEKFLQRQLSTTSLSFRRIGRYLKDKKAYWYPEGLKAGRN